VQSNDSRVGRAQVRSSPGRPWRAPPGRPPSSPPNRARAGGSRRRTTAAAATRPTLARGTVRVARPASPPGRRPGSGHRRGCGGWNEAMEERDTANPIPPVLAREAAAQARASRAHALQSCRRPKSGVPMRRHARPLATARTGPGSPGRRCRLRKPSARQDSGWATAEPVAGGTPGQEAA